MFKTKLPPNVHFFAWGNNQHGQLGIDSLEPYISLPQEVPLKFLDNCIADEIRSIHSGHVNTFVVMKNGRVFASGLNNMGQLGKCDFEVRAFQLQEHLNEFCIRNMAIMLDTCYAVTDDEICLGWGSNCYGQLGENPVFNTSIRLPIEMCSGVRQVAAGYNFVAVLTVFGQVWTCGDGRFGQLGRPNEIHWKLSPIETEESAIRITCGQYNGALLTENLRVFIWGSNTGTESVEKSGLQELSMPCSLEGPLAIKCGWKHSGILVYDTGELILWGSSNLGQLGQRITSECEPKIISELKPIKKFALGYGHTIAVIEKGIVLCWGENSSGSCGIGHREDVLFPLKTRAGMRAEVSRVFAGYKQSFALAIRY